MLTKEEQAKGEETREIAEDARETEWHHPSFVGELFMGRFRDDLITPYPEQSKEDKRIGDEYLARMIKFLKEEVDSEKIDKEGKIPQKVLDGLTALGAWGMKIPKEYGGLGLS
ncbi:MAG: acyl-CoA dehydrogenase family protein, partial [bacterium]|nr:acyl-CoA dehydrogenase family protein [bacterium]